MVDSIKPRGGQAQARPAAKSSDNTNLQKSFKNLSSGLSVSEGVQDQPAVLKVRRSETPSQVGRIVDQLNDAVRFSSEAVKALEEVVTVAAKEPGTGEIRPLARDLDKLQADVRELLSELRDRASTVAVLSENMDAAETRLEDVERAQQQAQSTGAQIQFRANQALGAHGSLSLDRVTQLLRN